MTKRIDAITGLTGLIAAVPALVTVVRCITSGWGIAGTDIASQFLPWWRFSARAIQSGHLPWWDPSVMCGYPHLADPQSAFFYPLNWLLLWIPSIQMLTFLLLSHLLLGAFGVFVLLRSHGRSNESALMMGGMYAFSAGLTAHAYAGHFSLVCAAAYLPFAVFLAEKYAACGGVANASRLGICLGVQTLTGHPQTVLITLIGCAVAAGINPQHAIANRRRLLVELSVGLLCTVLIACAPLSLGWELVHETARTEASNELIARDALPLLKLGTFLLPDFQGGISGIPYDEQVTLHETMNYIGMAPLALVFLSSFRRQRTALTLIAIGLLLSILPGLPVLEWQRVPILGMFRGWARAMLLTTLGMSMLAADGLDRIILNQLRFRRVVNIILFISIALTAFALTVNPLNNPLLRGLIRQEFLRNLGMLLLTLAMLRVALVARLRPFALPAIALLIVADVSITWHRYLTPRPIPDDAILVGIANDPIMANRIGHTEATPRGRLLIHGLPESINKYLMVDADTIVGYRPLPLKRFEEFFSLIDELPADTPAIYAYTTRRNRLTELSSIEWRLSPSGGIDPTGLEYIGPVGPAHLFRDPRAVPRVRAVGEYRVIPDRQARLQWLVDPDWDPVRLTIVEVQPDFPSSPESVSANKKITSQYSNSGGSIDIFTDYDRAGLLIVSDSWYPGWHAAIDSSPVPILRADHLFRAIQIPEGRHQVTLRYEPGWRIGAVAITLLSLFLSGLWFVLAPRTEVDYGRRIDDEC